MTATVLELPKKRVAASTSQENTQESHVTLNQSASPAGLRITESFAQYDVSKNNPTALENLGRALAGSLHQPEHTFYDPETKQDRQIGDVLVSIDLRDPDKIVLQHKDSAGKGKIGNLLESFDYINHHPLKFLGMKVLGAVSDPEQTYMLKVIQMISALEQKGMFGPPGNSTLDLKDWEFTTAGPWRNVIITRADPKPEQSSNQALPALSDVSFSDVLRNAAKLDIV